MAKRKNNPLVVGSLVGALTFGGATALPTNANAQATGAQGAATTQPADTGRAPGFPATLQQDYVPAAPNDLGVGAIFVDYLNSPNAVPSIKLNVGRGFQQVTYLGFNDDGVWLMPYNVIPSTNNKPITVRIVDGRAVITPRDAMPRGLRNPSSTYLAEGPGASGSSTTVAANTPGTTGRGQRRPNPLPGILDNPDVNAALRGAGTSGTNTTTAAAAIPAAALNGTGARISTGGLLTFKGTDNADHSYRVERMATGTPDPNQPLQGAYLFVAPDKSGVLFTLYGDANGRVGGTPLTETAIGMLRRTIPQR